MKRWFGRVAIGLAGLASTVASADARITHIEITKTQPAFGGESFGDAGAYEHLTGRVTGLSPFERAANDLVAQRFLLPDDADALVKASEAEGVRNGP